METLLSRPSCRRGLIVITLEIREADRNEFLFHWTSHIDSSQVENLRFTGGFCSRYFLKGPCKDLEALWKDM